MGENIEGSKNIAQKADNVLERRTRWILGLSVSIFGIAFLICTFIIANRNRTDYSIRESNTVLNAMSTSTQANIQNYKDVSRLIMLNGQVRTFLNAEEIDSGLMYDTRMDVMNILISSDNVDSVFVFRDDGTYMCTGRGDYFVVHSLMITDAWQNRILSERGGAAVFMNGNEAIFRQNGEPIISIGRAIYDIDSQKRVGILLVNITREMLEKIVFDQNNSEICILTDKGEYLAGNQELSNMFSNDYLSTSFVHYEKEYKGSKRMVSGCKLTELPLVIMCATETKASAVLKETLIILGMIFAVFIGVIFLCAFFISKNITNPVFELSKAMEKTKQTGFLAKIDVSMPDNELGRLAESYNSMIEHINEMFRRLIDQEKSVQKAEMRVLQEQIKPHFLYNSLESISYMALEAGNDKVHSALETLGSFYRNFLSKGDREIPLNREIRIIKDYLALQKLRYGDIINDEYDIAENTLECQIPKLILQPLVENSIYHGIRLTGEPGIIRVTTRIEDDCLHIIVYDTGVGMTPEDIEKIIGNEDNTEEGSSEVLSGFGLRGTIERIRYYCNNRDVVSIRSEVGEFTEIELMIPCSGKETA